MHEFSHKQFGYVFRYVFHDGSKHNTRVVREFAARFMGGDGWWCNIPKMMQDQRFVCLFICPHSQMPHSPLTYLPALTDGT